MFFGPRVDRSFHGFDPFLDPRVQSDQPDPFLAARSPIEVEDVAAWSQCPSPPQLSKKKEKKEGRGKAKNRAAQHIDRDMKVAPKVIFLFKDQDGLGPALAGALRPDPSSDLRRLEDSFELPLERYGIGDHGAHGEAVHFVDDHGVYQMVGFQ